jgi:hypothetical protein
MQKKLTVPKILVLLKFDGYQRETATVYCIRITVNFKELTFWSASMHCYPFPVSWCYICNLHRRECKRDAC